MISQNKNKDGVGNTRLILGSENKAQFSCHLDYLRVKGILSPDEWEQLINYFPKNEVVYRFDTPWSPGGNSVFFPHKVIGIRGIVGGFKAEEETGKINFMIDFSGTFFDNMNIIDQWRFCSGLYYTYKCTAIRIDLAIDDSTYENIPVDAMRKAWEQGNSFYFRNYKYIESGSDPKNLDKTHYFGSRNSGKMVRIYDHGGECLRFETEYKRKYANIIFEAFVSLNRAWFNADITNESQTQTLDEWIENLCMQSKQIDKESIVDLLHGCKNSFDLILQKFIGALAVSAIDFRSKNEVKDKQKASFRDTTRLSFYQKFIEKVGIFLKPRLLRNKCSLEKTVAWMQRQVSKTLSIIRDGIGIYAFTKWMNELTLIGRDKQEFADMKIALWIKDNPEIVNLNSQYKSRE